MPVMQRALFISCLILTISVIGRAQDTLPRFSVTARGTGKILISWHNTYKVTTQITIQRSLDSVKNFTSLITVPDPTLPENGAVDNKATHPNYWYRLFIVQQEGKYIFTPARRPGTASQDPVQTAANKEDLEPSDPVLNRADHSRILFSDPRSAQGKLAVKSPAAIKGNLPDIEVQKSMFVKKGDTLFGAIPGSRLRNFRDSLLTKTKDTLIFIDGDTLLIRPFVPKEIYRVSQYVFTGKMGNIQVVLPDAGKRKYAIKFYDDTNQLLFELTSVKTSPLILDKTNFLHAGWFRFELSDGEQLKEKNKFFIPKEF